MVEKKMVMGGNGEAGVSEGKRRRGWWLSNGGMDLKIGG